MMRTKTVTLFSAIILSVGFIIGVGGTSVFAHEGHSACPGGAPAVVDAGLFPGSTHNDQGVSGEEASKTAQAGLVDESLLAIHAAFCEPSQPEPPKKGGPELPA
jgi:hypothetical protein